METLCPPYRSTHINGHFNTRQSQQRVLRAFAFRQQRQRFAGDVGLEMRALLMRLEGGLVAEQLVEQELRRIFLATPNQEQLGAGIVLGFRQKVAQNVRDLVGLSFLGLGVQPPMTSLGNMVGYGREYLTRAPWIMLAPATTIVITTLAVSVIGDWLRDRLDPTLQ